MPIGLPGQPDVLVGVMALVEARHGRQPLVDGLSVRVEVKQVIDGGARRRWLESAALHLAQQFPARLGSLSRCREPPACQLHPT